jgi:chemotaxis response regulator CheB
MQQEAIGAFVDYLDGRSRIPVRPVQSGTPLLDGVCYVHPAAVPIEVLGDGSNVFLEPLSEPIGTGVLDHCLITASRVMGHRVMTILLSGGPEMGVEGLRAVKEAHGITLAQDPMSCVDPRLAETAIRNGLVDRWSPADNLVEIFVNLIG